MILTVSEKGEVHAECKLADTSLDFERFFLALIFLFFSDSITVKTMQNAAQPIIFQFSLLLTVKNLLELT